MFGKPIPFEGNWNFWCKIEISQHPLEQFGKPIPFEGNWNEVAAAAVKFLLSVRKAYPVWRELKLLGLHDLLFDCIAFGKPIPFEGNWNGSPCISPNAMSLFGKPIPFEGNWNRSQPLDFFISLFCSESLSRLKGIETICAPRRPKEGTRSESLSRLKGIETFRPACLNKHRSHVRKAYPVWRELKHLPSYYWKRNTASSESLSRLKGIETWYTALLTSFNIVRKAYPVWRELKLLGVTSSGVLSLSFGKPIPFEGNWNGICQRLDIIKVRSSERPSRLKGIETLSVSTSKRLLKIWFRKTFPFEGNWNSSV